MYFELYTEMPVRDCLLALVDRMETKETATRPALDGWVEKGGRFSLAVTSMVGSRFQRTTRLRADAERNNNVTIIRGHVAGGMHQQQYLILLFALVAAAIALISSTSEPLVGGVVVALGAIAYIPLKGDQQNSEVLLKELQRTCKARETPPRSISQP